ncbi:MAG: hypothetical protein LBT55_04745 [Clostridiaceae bacterium]|jgi:hypothetical protein|nr:hypothetical protein [Clostridiaceae bacterium]
MGDYRYIQTSTTFNIKNFKNAYEVIATPIDMELPHFYSAEDYPCVVYEFIDINGNKRTARAYKQVKKEQAEQLIELAASEKVFYREYIYPSDYKPQLGVGSYLTFVFAFVSVASFCLYFFLRRMKY